MWEYIGNTQCQGDIRAIFRKEGEEMGVVIEDINADASFMLTQLNS